MDTHDLLQTVQDTVPEDGDVGNGAPLNGNSLLIRDALTSGIRVLFIRNCRGNKSVNFINSTDNFMLWFHVNPNGV